MATIRFIESNSLEFRREEDINSPQTPSNRLYNDITYFNQYRIPYCQKVEQTDDLWFQFRTDYIDFYFYLYDENGTETALTYLEIETYDNFTTYQINVDASLLSGYYYIRGVFATDVGKPIANYHSQNFNVKESFANTLLIEWYGNSAIDIPMEWEYQTKTQELRIEGELIATPISEATTTVGSDNNPYFTDFVVIDKYILQIELLPDYLAKILNIAIGHDLIRINGQEYCALGGFDTGDRLGRSQMYKPNVEIQTKDYQNYSSDPEITGDLPVIPATTIMASSGVSIMASLGVGIKAT